jgi:hypothetical protein
VLDDLLPICFTLAVVFVGALALSFIADGGGKFRARPRKTKETFDQDAVAGTLNPAHDRWNKRYVTEVYDQNADNPYEKY